MVLFAPCSNKAERTWTAKNNFPVNGGGSATLEVTQAIQSLDLAVPLIAQKPTVVRAFLKSDKPVVTTVSLYGRSVNGTAFAGSPLRSKPIAIGTTFNRLTGDGGAEFDIPSTWLAGGDALFEILSADKNAPCGKAGDCTFLVVFRDRQALYLQVDFIRIPWVDENGVSHDVSYADCISAAEQIKKLYPIARLSFTCTDQIERMEVLGGIWDQAEFRAALDEVDELLIDKIMDDDYCYSSVCYALGLIPDVPGAVGGLAWIGGRTGVAAVNQVFTAAHELGHQLGLPHWGSCNEPKPGSYPYGGGSISPPDATGNAVIYGFDPTTRKVYHPTKKDVMTYCFSDRWISATNYVAIRNTLLRNNGYTTQNNDSSTAAENAATTIEHSLVPQDPASFAAPTSVLAVGEVDLGTRTGRFRDVAARSTSVTLRPSSGDVTIRVVDAGGAVLSEVAPPVRTSADDDHRGQFIAKLPWNAMARAVELRFKGTLLDRRVLSGNAPAVTVITPSGGEVLNSNSVTLTWSASDPDGDALRFSVAYTSEGRKGSLGGGRSCPT